MRVPSTRVLTRSRTSLELETLAFQGDTAEYVWGLLVMGTIILVRKTDQRTAHYRRST